MDTFIANILLHVLSFYLFWGCFEAESDCVPEILYYDTAPAVSTTLGAVRGSLVCSRRRKTYFQYLGIPYAEPPIGKLRFEPPVRKVPWPGIQSTNLFGFDCLQFEPLLLGQVLGNENCLSLNVFTPSVRPTKLYPVMVWIHGGIFTGGGSRMYTPWYFMDNEDIVVVSMNYRLGVLGFLNTGDDLVRGNMGFKDQVMALQFVRDNIARFGGDPQKVTLFGQGSGGASVHYHIISPLSKGLFHRAMMQSGNVFSPWAFTRNPRNQALKFGGKANCTNETTTALVNCLKLSNGEFLVSRHYELMSPVSRQDDLFAGSVEMGPRRNDTFLAENPFTILKRGDFNRVPAIFGVNSGDGALKTARLEAYPDILKSIHTWEGWSKVVPILLHYNKDLTNVSTSLYQYYFPETGNDVRRSTNDTSDTTDPYYDHGTDVEVLKNITRMISAGVWFYPTELAARNHSKFAPTYLNYFSFTSKSKWYPSIYTCLQYASLSGISRTRLWVYCYLLGVFREQRNEGNNYGVVHLDDMAYYWRMGLFPRIDVDAPNNETYEFSNGLIATLASFVKQDTTLKFGNVTWEQVNKTAETLQYLKLGRNSSMILHPHQEGINFIKSLNIWDPYNLNNY